MPTLKLIKYLKDLGIKFLTPDILSSILQTNNRNSIYKTANRLLKHGLLQKIDKGKFILTEANVGDFEIANFIIRPSYISLESALSFYGILPQFPYSITSVTTLRPRSVGKYEYSRISSNLFWGYIKKDNFLIATPEKALLDYTYLASKKLRNFDTSEWDLSAVDIDTFKSICSKIKFAPFRKLVKKLNIYD